MAIHLKYKDVEFGVGDVVKVKQVFKEQEKERTQIFEGLVISIGGSRENRTFTVRRIGEQKVGIEKIFPIDSPLVQAVEVVKKGSKGVRRSKLYFVRTQSKKKTDQIHKRHTKKKR